MTVSASHDPSERLSHVASKLRLYADMLDTIADADTVAELLAQVFEYEHALGHVAECAEGGCSDCVKVARSALARDNRRDFTETARDHLSDEDVIPMPPITGVEVVLGTGAVPCDYPDCPSLSASLYDAYRCQDGVMLRAEVRGCVQHGRWASRRAKAELSR